MGMASPNTISLGEALLPKQKKKAASPDGYKKMSTSFSSPGRASHASEVAGLRAHMPLETNLKDRKEQDRTLQIAAMYLGKVEMPAWVDQAINAAEPVAHGIVDVCVMVSPYVVQAVKYGMHLYDVCPVEILTALYGLALCFFGGFYVAAISAIAAFDLSGGAQISMYIQDLKEEWEAVAEMSAEDDKEDLDGDGVADVLQMSKRDLAIRKVQLFMTQVNPDRITLAIGGLYQAFLGMLITVQFKFAQTVALAVSLADNARKPMAYVLTPLLAKALPEETHVWINPAINYFCKFIGLTFAWTVQRVVACVQSAINGGHICAVNLMEFGAKRLGIEFDHTTTMIDEYVGWGLAALGIWFQITSGFALSFPFNILLLPLTIVEFFLEWAVTFMSEPSIQPTL